MPKLMEVLKYSDETGVNISRRVPENGESEIKWGAQLTVSESQEALFYRDGKILSVFGPGRYVLETQNIPIVGKWVTSFGYGPESPFRSEVYFISKNVFTGIKWGTTNSVLFKDSDFNMIRLKSFGVYSFRVLNSSVFLNKVVGTRGEYTVKDIQEFLRNIIVSKFTQVLGLKFKNIYELPVSFDQFNLVMKIELQSEFSNYGLIIEDFYINSISLPDEVQKIIDQKTSMTAVGNLDDFMKYKLALSIENASNNESGLGETMYGGIGAGMGMGMGLLMPQLLQQSLSEKSESSPVEKLKRLKELLELDIIDQTEYDEKRKKYLDQI